MNAYSQPQALNTNSLEVGTEVAIVSHRYRSLSVVRTTVARVTPTTVTLANGHAFNAERASRYGFGPRVGEVKRGERKTAKVQWPDEYATLVHVDDPWLAEREAREEAEKAYMLVSTQARNAAHDAHRSLTKQNAEAAIAALQAFLEVAN